MGRFAARGYHTYRTGAHSCLMKAMRTGDVSAVTPFRYTRLLFGAGLGIIMFDETLTLGMLVGSGLIVLSGLFILWRGQKKVAVGDPAAQASESTIYPLLPYLVMHHASAEVAYLQAGGVASGFLARSVCQHRHLPRDNGAAARPEEHLESAREPPQVAERKARSLCSVADLDLHLVAPLDIKRSLPGLKEVKGVR